MAATPRLLQVAQRAHDIDRAIGFYGTALGLTLIARFDPPGLAFFDLGGGVRLLLGPGDQGSLLYLYVDDLGATVASLAAADHEVEQEPHLLHVDADGQFGEAGTEEWLAIVRDTEGNLVGLIERRPAG